MTDNTLLIFAALALGALSEFVLQPFLVWRGWSTDVTTWPRRIAIRFPMDALIAYALLHTVYVQYFLRQP